MKKKNVKVTYSDGKVKQFVIRNDSEGFIFTVGSLKNPKIIPSIQMMTEVQDMIVGAFKNPPFNIFLPPFVTVKKYKLCKKKENNEEKKKK